MGINRPSNLNIRDVPGNGGIVGPSTTPSCGVSTTTCETCHNTCDALSDVSLGSRYVTLCACPCCDIVCSCDCTVYDRTIPSGMWKTSEQYEAKGRDAWGADTSCSTVAACVCNINSGCTCCTTCTTCVGGYTWCKASNIAWVVAPSSSEVIRSFYCRNHATSTAGSCTGCGGWFIPSANGYNQSGLFKCAAYCREYWDAYNGGYWSSDTQNNDAFYMNMNNKNISSSSRSGLMNVRAFRCVSY